MEPKRHRVDLEAALAAAEARIRRLELQLAALADHDPLTDLLNRRSAEQVVRDHLAGCVRFGPEGALLLVGLDGLDAVEAALGRPAVDDLVVAVAEALVGRLRHTDVVARWASSELAVLLPRNTAREAEIVAGHLMEVVAGTGSDRVPPGHVSASVGVACITDVEDVDDLVVRASLAMLRSRREGCRVAVAAPAGSTAS